ncbi:MULTISPECIES: hypothetical protein [unclassified Haloferax]|uniref:hypothetical protein n=1 Tax=Haloferax TaxID=2251 RepID=UPI0002B13915|nr:MULTISPECIES: hypothetical protein [unclassified Haloferax]ELZ55231.1 hypothetical protein C460_16237 [Haloferax sp. ATCC BAA-646]ELZ66488.1 hypothetical protein C459_03635 [Haloferax sp. ATCC BAA-645]
MVEMSERDDSTTADEADIETMVSTDSTPEPTESTEDAIDDEETENREFAERMRRFLDYAVLAGLLLLALIAALQFYLNASQTITTWVNPEYRAPFQMAFNLVLLLGAALGVSVQLRRLASD